VDVSDFGNQLHSCIIAFYESKMAHARENGERNWRIACGPANSKPKRRYN